MTNIEAEKIFQDTTNNDTIEVRYYGPQPPHDIGLIIRNMDCTCDVLLSKEEFEKFYQHLTKVREDMKPRYRYEKVAPAVYQIHDRKLGYLKGKLFGVDEKIVADIAKAFNKREWDVP